MKHQLPDGETLYYEIQDKPQAEADIVFINGLSQSTIAWQGYIPYFKDKYRLIFLDLVFQGQSSAPEEVRSFEQHAADIVHLLQEGIGIQKAHFVGISYGGAVLQRLMVNHPEMIKKAALLATFAHKTPIFEAWGLSWQRALEVGGYELLLDVMLPTVLGKSYFENPIIPIDLLKTARKDLYPKVSSLLKLMQATADSNDYRPTLGKCQVPAAVIVGEEDILCTPEMNHSIAEHLPNAEFHLIPQVGHTLNIEAIPQSAALIRRFLEQQNT